MGRKGGIKDREFFFKVINKCQDLDDPRITDCSLQYKHFQTREYYESKTKKFYENQDIFIKNSESTYSIINSVFYRLQMGRNYEDINNVIPLQHFSVSKQHLYMAFSDKYGWIIKQIDKSPFGTFVFLKNQVQMEQRVFSNVHELYDSQQIHLGEHYLEFSFSMGREGL